MVRGKTGRSNSLLLQKIFTVHQFLWIWGKKVLNMIKKPSECWTHTHSLEKPWELKKWDGKLNKNLSLSDIKLSYSLSLSILLSKKV